MTGGDDPGIIGSYRSHGPESADDHGEGRTFRLPDLGEGLTEAEVVAWRVDDGDVISVDDVVVDVETAKATVEVPCPYAGRVVERHAGVGDVVQVGQPLVTVADTTDDADGSGAVLVGYGTGHGPPRRRERTASRAGAGGAPGDAARVISPVVRRLARELGVDVHLVRGSGPAGVIVRRDVEAAAATARPSAPDRPDAADRPDATHTIPQESREHLRGIRRATAETLARSRREIPDASTWVDVDATALVEAKDAIRAGTDRPVGLLALLGRVVVAGLQRYPQLNSSVEHDADELIVVRHGTVNLGFAAQTDRGLVVPVVRGADRMNTGDLADEIARLTALAREGRLEPEHLTGGTFTLNNYGVFGVDGSTPIINHPEAALLGVGRFTPKPWVVGGELAVRTVGQLSLTFDHRVCDGGVAGGFLRWIADRVESPIGLLADL
ncbi:pyruvate dehydrogenase E2 component (dihydrolipoamide acetyltransferase) [Haloactinopolyspora alba]|uniref:Dihydrolipoamide acetyltransferase component of pyruvate dehydrogenase complex n=1 Tax=Haloactinopolyspora alba TaxID=648780 RepID=A0A2P8E7B2_9ACTN|nr:dihydrolipoamide acetyltransferase family protein [Haloactinopolyspora alba]PSL05363.1 pyruvate dehydrogenase E2 component (dihydrolipoamide acetyltransferase) [Haloactinopolyspora alba]